MQNFFPCKLRNYDSIVKSLQKYSEFLLDRKELDTYVISSDDMRSISPELWEQFKEFNINFEVARFCATPPKHVLPIHQDTADTPKIWALNLPIYNCANTAMIWYTSDKDPVLAKPPEGYGTSTDLVRWYPEEQCVEVERCELIEPMWVRIDVPHNVINPVNSANRIIISLRFDITRSTEWNPYSLPDLSKVVDKVGFEPTQP